MIATVLLAGACDGSSGPGEPGPVAPAWREVSLPMPAGAPGRLALRDATACGGRWYVVGAVVAADGTTRPAAWTSGDGAGWSPLRLTARSTYGQVAVLYAAGCRDGVLAAVGAQSGGAHGNPRVTQWYVRPGGILDEVLAAFELYGGPDAVNVGRISGGPAGWLVTGNRVRGAAVWVSADGTAFQLVDGAPQLAGDSQLATEAVDATAYKKEWVVVGGGRRPGRTDSDPVVWTSADGRTWRRTVVDADERHQVMQRVVPFGDGVVAAGVAGDSFGAWVPGKGQVGRFGRLAAGGVQQVLGLVRGGGQLWAAATDGRAFGIWASPDGGRTWRSAEPPAALAAAGAERTMTVAAAGDALLLVADDGQRGRIWLAPLQGT